MSKKWGHNELAHDLANHLRVNNDHIVWEDMQMGPSGSIRPDVYMLKKSYSTFAPVTYEVKISVSDFRSDVTSGKWQGYLKYSSAVIFAVPAGLIKKEDVPAACGLIVRHDEVWRTVKRPVLQKIDTLPHAAWMKMMIDGIERATVERIRLRPSVSSWSMQDRLRNRFGQELGRLIQEAMQSTESLNLHRLEIERKRKEITDGHDQFVQRLRQDIKNENKVVDDAVQELGKVLGLKEGFSAYDLSFAVHQAARRLTEDGELQRMRKFFERLKGITAEALEPLPGEVTEPWQQI